MPQVLELIEEQSRKIDQKLGAILLVGGFSGSEYLFRKVEVRVWQCCVYCGTLELLVCGL